MKTRILSLVLTLLVGLTIFSGCGEKKQFGDAEKQAVTDTINRLMTQLTGFAETANAEATFQWLDVDSNALFVSENWAHSRSDLVARFKALYHEIGSQKIEPVKSMVLVFSPESAAWIGVAKGKFEGKGGKKVEQILAETWIWQFKKEGWRVVHYHESIMNLPDASIKAEVEKGMIILAEKIHGRTLTPAEMPALLTEHLQKNPLIYGATFAFAPTTTDGKTHRAAPYLYRSGNEFKQVDLPEAFDYTVSEWYATPVETKSPAWSNPYFDAGGGGVVMVTYSIPMFDRENNLIGVLTSDVEVK